MRSMLEVLLVLLLSVFLLTTASHSHDTKNSQVRFQRAISEGEFLSDIAELDPGLLAQYTSAAVDTYCIVWFDFDYDDWQGWTGVDDTEQRATFFHADDFAGLGGGESGRLVPIQGNKSMWCGARPGTDDYMCSWASAPGYGNNWRQLFETIVTQGPPIRFSYHGVFDSEPGYDYTYVEYANQGCCDWRILDTWDGVVDTVVSHEIYYASSGTKLRFRFESDCQWSDEDGLHSSDGACILDSIVVEKEFHFTNIEDFEDWEVGETSHTGSAWHASRRLPFGKYSGLWSNLENKFDPCNYNFSTQIVFFVGSPYPSDDYPGLYETPFCYCTDCYVGFSPDLLLCQRERVVSPIIDLTKYSTGKDHIQDADIPAEDLSALGGTILRYTIYQDLPLSNLVFPGWDIRDISETGCPGPWENNYFITYYWPYGYVQKAYEIGGLIDSERIQVSLVCHDMCSVWYLSYGDCAEHTPSPWYDNVRLYRYTLRGPQWNYRWLDLFQDNFPMDEHDLESWVRADAANDLNANDNPVIRPGDSIVVDCTSPLAGGLRNGGMTGEAEVYMHVRAADIGPAGKPALFGSDLVGTYGTYVSDDGEWTIIQCDSALSGGVNVVDDKFMVDLNDELFTRGYMIEYYFEAHDLDSERSTLPRYADEGQYFEFTCLPTGGSDILFVDDFHGRGSHEGVVELYYNWTFNAVIPPGDWPDRYDVNSPTSLVSNGPGSRAYLNQLKYNEGASAGYKIIAWDSGNLESGTITDGSTMSDKSDDCTMLIDWLDQSENDVGLWIAGDNIAFDLNRLPSAQALQLMSTWCGVNFVEYSYFDLTGGRVAGGVVTPLCTGSVGGIFGSSLEFYAFGGCPVINKFDVIDATANGAVSVLYPEYDGDSYATGIQSVTVNAAGYNAKTLWLGFSLMYVRDVDLVFQSARNQLLADFLLWNYHSLKDPWEIGPLDDEVPSAYKLSQNFPNPFNPTTTIKFDIRAKGHVSLKIYNVAGQLVKTMVDEVMDAGSYTKEWKGTNNLGAKVASGVYFYRLEAGEYENVKKMVLLR
jgi:hypothetical protein